MRLKIEDDDAAAADGGTGLIQIKRETRGQIDTMTVIERVQRRRVANVHRQDEQHSIDPTMELYL